MDKKQTKKLLDSKLWTAVISLLIGFGLWLYVVTTNSTGFETTFYNIPVNLKNESLLAERGLMIVENQTPEVDLRLAGNRTDINNLSSSNITITVDMASLWEPGTVALEYGVSYPGNVPNNAVSIQERSPSRVALKVERRATKMVPVEIQYTGVVPEGYLVDKDNVELQYAELQLSGPASVMENIAKAVVNVNLEGQSQTLGGQYPFTLCDTENQPVDAALVSVPVENIELMVRILRVKSIPLTVTVEAGGGATENTAEITVEPESIRISGPDSVLESINGLNLGTVRLGDLSKSKTLTFPITLPEGVNNETGITEVTVKVKFVGLVTRTFHVSNIKVTGLAEGLVAEGLTQVLEVQIRGPKDLMSTLTESNITAVVDFTDEAAGEVKKSVTITMDSQFAEAGAIGTYQVSATLKQETVEQ